MLIITNHTSQRQSNKMRYSGLSTHFCVVLVLATVQRSTAERTVIEYLDQLADEYEAVSREQHQLLTTTFAVEADATLDDLCAADLVDVELFIDTARLRLNQVVLLADGGLWEHVNLAALSAQKLHDSVVSAVAASGRADNSLDAYYLDDILRSVKVHTQIVVGGWKGVRNGYLADLKVTFDEIRRIAAENSDADAFADGLRSLWEKTLGVLDVEIESIFELINAVRRISIRRLRTDVGILLR